MSTALPSHIYSVLISLDGDSLILPNSAVVEVLGQDTLIESAQGPSWLRGHVEHQMHDIPVLSLESMLGQAVSELDRRCRIVILNSPAQEAAFAIISRAYPLIVTLNEVALQPLPMQDKAMRKLIFSKVQVANRTALIPDLDAIAAMARKAQA